jgi:hypothetical protein
MIKDILYTAILTFFIMVLLHHIYNYLQFNLTIPKVNEVIPPIENEPVIQKKEKEKDELKEYMNQFKKK